ncbi:MAG: hypothetical protein M3N48_00620 [Verrucomicrobiota bacterium]|nr:hypothetical protein [Verrucomicrobiota bacterium]
MAVAPEHYRAARLAIPQLPLAAILGFALFGVGGSVFLAYSSFSHAEGKRAVPVANDVRVYSARAVPFDPRREDAAQRAASITRALTATQTEGHRAEAMEEQGAAPVSQRALFAGANRELRAFHGFSNFAGANSFLAFTGTSFGISAQTAPSGFVAADAETISAAPVPEASTWLCGGALVVLVAARGVHAGWHRKRRRTDQSQRVKGIEPFESWVKIAGIRVELAIDEHFNVNRTKTHFCKVSRCLRKILSCFVT